MTRFVVVGRRDGKFVCRILDKLAEHVSPDFHGDIGLSLRRELPVLVEKHLGHFDWWQLWEVCPAELRKTS